MASYVQENIKNRTRRFGDNSFFNYKLPLLRHLIDDFDETKIKIIDK